MTDKPVDPLDSFTDDQYSRLKQRIAAQDAKRNVEAAASDFDRASQMSDREFNSFAQTQTKLGDLSAAQRQAERTANANVSAARKLAPANYTAEDLQKVIDESDDGTDDTAA